MTGIDFIAKHGHAFTKAFLISSVITDPDYTVPAPGQSIQEAITQEESFRDLVVAATTVMETATLLEERFSQEIIGEYDVDIDSGRLSCDSYEHLHGT